MKKLAFVLLAFAALPTGCDSHEAKATPTAPKTVQPASTADDNKALCVQVFTRARACTDDYIPALVDSRAKYDKPAGLADEVKKDRAAVIAQAKQEWAEDSKDAAIAQTCDRIAPQMIDDPSTVETARGCLAQQACGGFTTCVMPLFEKHVAK